jgi:hypothetical protein
MRTESTSASAATGEGQMLATVISLFLGFVTSLLISRYYFVRQFKHRLGVYLHSASNLLEGASPDVREAMAVSFRGQSVASLSEIVLLIANEGAHPIRDVIRKLTLEVPDSGTLLDAVVVHVHPTGRLVSAAPSGNAVTLNFDLLNAGDYFILKLLIDGNVSPRNLTLSISAEGLPPTLEPEFANYNVTDKAPKRLEGGLLLGATALALIPASIAVLIANLRDLRPQAFPFSGFVASALNFLILGAAIIVALVGLLVLVLSLMMGAAAVLGGSFPRSPTYVLPSHIARRGHFIHGQGALLSSDPEATRERLRLDDSSSY